MKIDIALVGVPKAGTSTLFDLLNRHEDIIGSSPKETFFFLDRVHPLFNSMGASYLLGGESDLDKFYPGNINKKLTLEGTTLNIYSDTARHYFEEVENTKVLISLRNPVERIYSLFRYVRDHQCNLDGNVPFSRFVKLALRGTVHELEGNFKSRSAYLALDNAISHSEYWVWLDKWRFLYDQDRLKIILFEELSSDGECLMRDVWNWLGVRNVILEELDLDLKINKTKAVKIRWLHQLARKVDFYLPSFLKPKTLKILYEWIQNGGGTLVDDPVDILKAKIALWEHFQPKLGYLSEEFDLNVGKWWRCPE